jgi:glycopeptide antibiotics resistance protein
MSEKHGSALKKEPTQHFTRQRILGLMCLISLYFILYAGLTPFGSPPNQVTWIPKANAVHFGEYGTILGSESFPPPGPSGERSIEMWAQPARIEDSSTLFAFYSPASPRYVSLSQEDRDLDIRVQPSSAWRTLKAERIRIVDAFRDGKSAFWAVTFSPSGTAVYRDGALVRRSNIAPSGSELSGLLVLGTSPIFNKNWSGELRGLAIFDTALNQGQIARHYVSWTKGGAPALISDDVCLALYLFNEHVGGVAHNIARSGYDLYIPRKYLLLRQTVLDPVWRAFNWSRGYWEDAFINVAGFIPFGCVVCAYFSARELRTPSLYAAAVGAAASIFIELTQTHLPTRDSSMSDLMNNILGSVLGSAAYRGQPGRVFDRWMSWFADALNGVRWTA